MITPVYAAADVRVFEGDALETMGQIPDLDTVSVVLTDPPYAANRYCRELDDAATINLADDARWCGDIFHWVGTWLHPLRKAIPADASGWIFCNVHYVGFYLRWTHLLHWPLRGVFGFGTGEFLLAFGATPLTAEDMGVIDLVLTANRYGQGKSVAMLRALIQTSQPGVVLDPFCGSGSTLLAAREEGRVSVGLDCDPKALARTVALLEGNADATVRELRP